MLDRILYIYNRLQLKLFLIPFLNIDKSAFLYRQTGSRDDCHDQEVVRRRSHALILVNCVATSLLTFLFTLPDNLWLSLVLAVVDLLQFQFFLFIIQQQLLYLYGYKNLHGASHIATNDGFFLIWLQNEVMLGGSSIKNKLKSGVGFVMRKSIMFFVTKSPFRLVLMTGLRQMLKWCGVVISHQMLDISIDMVACVICAMIAALVSLWQFYPMCSRLRANLDATDINFYYDKWQAALRKCSRIEDVFKVDK